jgi:hypothetical protein
MAERDRVGEDQSASLTASSCEVLRHFEFSRHQGLGVCISAIRVTGGSVGAVVIVKSEEG